MKIDLFLLLLGIIFLVGALIGKIDFKIASLVFILHTGTLLFAMLAKVKTSRINSGLSYFLFGTGFAALKMYADGEVFLYIDYLFVGLIVAIVPFIFRFRAFAITGSMLGYWLALFYSIVSSWSKIGVEELTTAASENFLFGLGENLSFATFVFGFLMFGFLSLASSKNKKSKRATIGKLRPSLSAGTYSSNSTNNIQDYDWDYNDIPRNNIITSHSEEDEDDYSYSSKESEYEYEYETNYPEEIRTNSNYYDDREDEKTNHYGWTQSSIDLDNEKEYYGTPSWYEEKQIEEKDYGLPWYARDEDDGFGRPAWARNDEDED